MAKGKRNSGGTTTQLTTSRQEAWHHLKFLVDHGHLLLINEGATDRDELEDFGGEIDSWCEKCAGFLRDNFTTGEFAEEFDAPEVDDDEDLGLEDTVTDLRRVISERIDVLNSIYGRLESVEEVPDPPTTIFVVHGHDKILLNEVTAFLRGYGCEVVILNDRPNHGETIYQKVQRHGSEVDYAVVLLMLPAARTRVDLAVCA